MIQVSGLFIYPVKGLRGTRLDQAILTARGLTYDRHWMVVMPNGRMVTQRQKPMLATLVPSITANGLTISAPGHAPLHIATANTELENTELESVDVSVWRDQFAALDEGEAASRWLTKVLQSNYPLRLVRMDDNVLRPQSNPDLLGEHCSTQFADAAPFLVTNENSLVDLNENLLRQGHEAVGIERFRPNILLSGMGKYEEYSKASLQEEAGHYSIRLCYPSERCVVVNTDQVDGSVNKETQQPLNTLKELNTAPALNGAYFGQNSVLERGQNKLIKLGDRLLLVNE